MTSPHADPDRLRAVKTFPQLVKYLHDELEWPIESDDFDDLTFDYSPEELGLDPKTAVKVKEIKQLRPLSSKQPWGIFFLQFEPKRLPVVVLRRILQALVLKKRASVAKAHQAAWNLHDLLFISSYGESDHRDISFAHFAEDEDSNLPSLKVLGWDDEDTVLHLDHAHKTLQEKLHWPEGDADIKAWRERWASAFTLRHREVITTSKEMAVRLAHLATAIRKRVNQILAVETEQGALRQLMKGFREALIHDLTEDDFADMYAQTVTYGLLTARISQPKAYASGGLTDLPITNPFLRDLLSQFMRVGGRKGKLDFDELGIHEVVQTLLDANMQAVLRDFGDKNPQEDPVIHFYELFLKEYDPKKRTSRGVFYTPRPVVSYIVRSVHELLQTEFGLEDGLASTATWGDVQKKFKDLKLPPHAKASDPFVRILDPATGTGTFLVECIEVIHGAMTEKWRKQGHYNQKAQDLWNDYVPKHLLSRLYGFELMMAPYAIAHMKVGLKLFETGYQFGADERARIYLTNSLEPPGEVPQQMLFEETALAHEAQAVNALKKNIQFTVVMGNPPYSGHSYNMTSSARAIVERYKSIDGTRIVEKGALQLEKNINDDYVKFLAFAQMQTACVPSIIGIITNHSFLENPTLRGLRWNLLNQFSLIKLLDLGGNVARKEKGTDENVFDISQGVAISILTCPPRKAGGKVEVSRMRGLREDKYKALTAIGTVKISFKEAVPIAPYFLFRIEDIKLRSEYNEGTSLTELFPTNSTGVKTHRDDFCIDFDFDPLRNRIADLIGRDLSDREIREKYGLLDTYGWALNTCRKRLRADRDWQSAFGRILYRPFDWRHIYFSPHVIELARMEVSRNFLNRDNLGPIFMRQVASDEPYSHFGVTRDPVDNRCFYSNRGTMSFAPLCLIPSQPANDNLMSRLLANGRTANIGLDWTQQLQSLFSKCDKGALTPNDTLCYTYGIVHSITYRTRYAEFLKIDFPRIPLTPSPSLFQALAKLGFELVALHLVEFLLEDEKPKNAVAKAWPVYPRLTEFIGKVPSLEIEKVSYGKKTVWLDKAQSVGFKGVPEEVWEFHIGGYQVCEKWLKDRKGRRLMAEDVLHYHKIVTAISNTIRLMKEIDKVIDKHGGWPGAFAVNS